jgi:hypothetical protein
MGFIIGCTFGIAAVWLIGCLFILILNYPYDPPSCIGWWPIWLATIFPIRLVKLTWKGLAELKREIAKEIKG